MAILFFLTPLAHAEEWTEDINQAIKDGKAAEKDLLLLYTGSDWCPPCKKLEAEILSKDDFLNDIQTSYVLVKLDFPQNTPQEEKIKQRNQEWLKKYGIEGFPTIVLIDSKQRPYGFTGYESSGVEDYLGIIEELRQARIRRDEFLEQAKEKEGLERAQLLDQAMSELREEIVSIYYEDIVNEIVELDKDDDLGLRTKWNEAKENELRKIILTDIMMIARLEKAERALAFIDQVTAEIEFPPGQQLQVFQIKLNLLQKLRKPDEVYGLLDKMIALDGVDGTIRERLIVKKILMMVGNGDRDQAMKLLEDSLAEEGDNLFMYLAKGELLDSEDKHEEAIKAYDKAIPKSRFNPDLLADLIGAKADALTSLDDAQAALQLLDNFADDTEMPSDLRSEILLHKAMILRDQGRTRLAKLAENRAVELAQSSRERSEMQRVVEQLRQKFEDQ